MSRHNFSHRHSGSHHASPGSAKNTDVIVGMGIAVAGTVVVASENGRQPMHSPVLVLNASYEPINICAARRALVLVLKGVASAEEVAPAQIHSARRTLHVPSVIRLLEYRRIPHQTRALSRKNILMRDRYSCQ